MLVANPDFEIQMLKTICNYKGEKPLYARVDRSYFGEASCLEIYDRCLKYIEAGHAWPTFDTLKSDLSLPSEGKHIVNSDHPYFQETEAIEAGMRTLTAMRRGRVLLEACAHVLQNMNHDGTNTDDMLTVLSEEMQRVNENRDGNEMMHYKASDKKTLQAETYKKLNEDDNSKDYMPTGFPIFDQRTGGIRRKNVFVLGASPGGGKSTLALQMAVNQYMAGLNVCFVSYEMDRDEVHDRLLSNVSKVNHSEIILKKTGEDKKQLIVQRYGEFLDQGEKNNTLTIWSPERELNMYDIAAETKNMGYDMYYIDYISLLKAPAKKPTHEVLGDHTRAAKLIANRMNAGFVLLAQYDNEADKIKYSKAIEANANFVWVWTHGEKEKQMGFVQIKQIKARNAEAYPFYLAKDFSTFSFSPYEGPPPIDESDDSSVKEVKGTGKKKSLPAATAPTKVENSQVNKPVNKSIPRMPQLI